jgi:hypothetical protein
MSSSWFYSVLSKSPPPVAATMSFLLLAKFQVQIQSFKVISFAASESVTAFFCSVMVVVVVFTALSLSSN